MNKDVSATDTGNTTIECGTSTMTNATTAAQAMLARVVEFTGHKLKLSPEAIVSALKQHDRQTLGYFQYGLAKQLAEQLAALDNNVQEVFLYDEADSALGDGEPGPLIHLLVRVTRKTEALNALIASLERALVQGYAGLVMRPHLAHLLDVQLVDEQDVKRRTGYGALLTSVHHRPLPVWERKKE